MRYRHKAVSPSNDIDKVIVGLKGTDSVLAPGQSLSFNSSSSAVEQYMWARYVMAPRTISYKTESDTILIICNATDSIGGYTAASDLIWERRDSKYYYLLTVKRSAHE